MRINTRFHRKKRKNRPSLLNHVLTECAVQRIPDPWIVTSSVTVHSGLCIYCKVRKNMIQGWANLIRGADFRWICECYWSRSEQQHKFAHENRNGENPAELSKAVWLLLITTFSFITYKHFCILCNILWWGDYLANDTKIVCRNVFKTKEKAAFTKEYTRKWIELINELERNKGQRIPAKS